MSQKISVTEKTIEYLKEKILQPETKIGDKLATEHEVCETLNVGRGSVREAFRNLEAQGYIEIKPGRGAFVVRKTGDDEVSLSEWFDRNRLKLNDYTEVREIVEPKAARLAAERSTEAELEHLTAIHTQFVAEGHGKARAKELARLDELFHQEIISMTKNEMLIFINDRIRERLVPFRLKTFQIRHNIENAIPAHEKILSALREHDMEIAEVYMRRHIDLITEDML